MAGVKVMKLLWVTLLLGAAISCGGGGGGDDSYSNASLKGVYYSNHFNFNPEGRQAVIETATFDGVGRFRLDQLISYFDPSQPPPDQQGTDTKTVEDDYTVNADGAVQMGLNIGVNDGLIGAGAKAIVAARINDNTIHNLSFFVKAPAAGSWAGGLSGDYHAISFRQYKTGVERITFDPNGTWAGIGFYTDGTLPIRKSEEGKGTYVIDHDGKLTFSADNSPETEQSWLSEDGTLLVSASATNPNEQKIGVAMKAGSNHTAASLRGTYVFAKLTSRSAFNGCVLGTLAFDGTSGVVGHTRFSDTETGTDRLPGTSDFVGTYNVNNDGTFSIQVGEELLDGVISADEKTIAFARMDSLTEHSIGVGVRR